MNTKTKIIRLNKNRATIVEMRLQKLMYVQKLQYASFTLDFEKVKGK